MKIIYNYKNKIFSFWNSNRSYRVTAIGVIAGTATNVAASLKLIIILITTTISSIRWNFIGRSYKAIV